ncbi:MAG: divergent polysaccharide deacetylase family protein, partial [Candidatus Aminicenantes bacterium]|nr:divergent polysaccharide deacetylase family protein [Candidatus Aminicenantes bacterium]
MKSKKKSFSHSQPRAAAVSFIVFIVIALAAVVLLEFLDYRAGKYSLIFSKVIPLRRALATSDKFEREWTETLVRDKAEFDFFKDREGIVHFKINVADVNFLPLTKSLHLLVEKYHGLSRLSEVQGMKEQTIYLYQVRFERQLTHFILLTRFFSEPADVPTKIEPPVPTTKSNVIKKNPRLALIIDDVGYTDSLAEQLRDLGIPLTAAVIPSAPYALGEADKIHAYGLEEIIHLPMQPKDP